MMSDESKIRELSESIRAKCAQHQMRQQAAANPGSGGTVTSPANNAAIQMTNEVRRRLKESIVRLQEEVRDPSLTGIQQRLKYTSSKLSDRLTYTIQRAPPNGITCYLSCESFYVEVTILDTGVIESVVLSLGQDNQQNSELLVSLLQKYEYLKFEDHLKALLEMFSQSSGQESSASLLKVIFAIENILLNINNPNSSSTLIDVILLNHLGHVTPRRAGLPMELTFFITPFEALSHQFLHEPNSGKVETLETRVGVSAKVQVERSTQLYRLPVDPELFNRSQTSFYPVTDQNSVLVHLTLVLCLSDDIPVCAAILEKLQQYMYGAVQSLPPLTTPHVDQLILKDESTRENPLEHLDCHKIYLPNQVHEYTGIHHSDSEVLGSHRGVLLPNRKVPFTHPMHVIKIIHLLRQQLVYNSLFKSCLRRRKKVSPTQADIAEISLAEDYSFHVTTSPPERIELSMELLTTSDSTINLRIEFHIPQENSPPTQPMVLLKVGSAGQVEQSPILDKILAKCLSIPVTMHSVLSRPDQVLPPSVAAVVKDHKLALSQFDRQLKSHDTSCDQMEIASGTTGGMAVATGTKRKRME